MNVIFSLQREGNAWMNHYLNINKQMAERDESLMGGNVLRACCLLCHAKRFGGSPHLLQIEDMVVEIILQLLICIVDAELLKTVGFKVLKAKYV